MSQFAAFGRMVEQNRSGTYTQFVYSPTGQKMQIMSGQAPPTKSIVALPGGGVAVFSASGENFYHADHLGSFRFGSTSNRTMYFDLAHAPFGDIYASSGSTDPAFTGQRADTVAGLYDFPAREYSIQGRWPSPDPAGLAAVDPASPQSWNRYGYVMNNPLMYVDPSGLDPCPNDNSWGAQLCKQAQAFRSTTFYNTWDQLTLSFVNYRLDPDVCIPNPSLCTSTVFISGNSSSGGGWVSWGLFKAINNFVKAACQAINPPDVTTTGVGGDLGTGIGGGTGFQLGIAANGNSGQLGFTFTHNIDLGFIGPDAYVYSGSIPKAADNSQVGGGFSSIANITNHVDGGFGRIGGSYGLDDHSKTITFGPSAFPFTGTFGTSRTGVFGNIPYAGYALNPIRAVCKAAGG